MKKLKLKKLKVLSRTEQKSIIGGDYGGDNDYCSDRLEWCLPGGTSSGSLFNCCPGLSCGSVTIGADPPYSGCI